MPRKKLPRVDRLTWAYAILNDELWWTYAGVSDPDYDTLRYRGRQPTRNKLAATLLGSEQYMENLFEAELDYQVKDGVYDDEWEDHCRDVAHREGRCPHASEKEKAQYETFFKDILENENRREEWYRRRMNDDWDWLQDHVLNTASDVYGILHHLKEHPVDGCLAVWNNEKFAMYTLDEIVGYCPECNQPATEEHIRPIAPPYPTNEDGEAQFLYPTLDCKCCGAETPLDDEEFLRTHKRPFEWPPGAPWPPRRGFLGEPMEASPWEE